MAVRTHPVTLPALQHICRNLRAADADELFALRWDDDPDALAKSLAGHANDMMRAVWLDDEPVAVAGALPVWPSVWTVLAFGTDRWDKVTVTLTRHVRRFVIPALYHAGARRAQCYASAEHHAAHEWLTRSLGARRGPAFEEFGRDGETFVLFEWLRQDAERLMRRSHVRRRP